MTSRSDSEKLSMIDVEIELRDLLDLMDELEFNRQPIPESVSERITALVHQRVESVDKLGRYLAVLQANALACRTECARLKSRAERFERHRDRIEEFILHAMKAGGMKKLSGQLHNMTYVEGREKVGIVDVLAIPDDAMRVVPETRAPDLVSILKRLKDGETVPGTRLERGNPFLKVT